MKLLKNKWFILITSLVILVSVTATVVSVILKMIFDSINSDTKIELINVASNITEGEESPEVFFRWDTSNNEKLKFVSINVTCGETTDNFIVEKDVKTFSYPIENDTVYKFSLTPVDNKGKVGKTSAYTKYHLSSLNANFPKMEIITTDYVWPTCDFVSPPSGSFGISITNNEYVTSIIRLYNSDNEKIYDSSEMEEDVADGSKIKIRGNSSAYTEKQSYKIKLYKKFDLLKEIAFDSNRNDGKSYADKNWLLIKTGDSLNTLVGFAVNELLNMDWTPDYSYVALTVNGDYRGLYILTENVKEGSGSGDKQSRIKINSDGFIFEYDPYWWNNDLYISSSIGKVLFGYTLKYPDEDDININSAQYIYLKDYLSKFENAMKMDNDEYLDYIDIESFVKWHLAHEIMGTQDIGGSNMFLTKKDSSDSSKIIICNLWDFDSICKVKYTNVNPVDNDRYFNYYLLNKTEYQNLFRTTFTNISGDLLTSILAKLQLVDSVNYDKLLLLENTRWQKETLNTQQQIDGYLPFFESRINWLNENIQN